MIHDRIHFLGDSITIGGNDGEGLGWPGRLTRDLMASDGRCATGYNPGVNGDTSLDIAACWQSEARARSREALVAGDKVHHGTDGYAMIAEAMAGWPAWRPVAEA